MKYKKVDSDLQSEIIEIEIKNFWEKNEIFKKSISLRKDNNIFTFYDGPPTANGMPHIGHILTRAIKDLMPRYKTMKGYKVLRRAGWDTHGLPVELEIEKNLKISGKTEIENYGVEEFIKKCKESVWKYEKEWKDVSERVGFWADMDNPYITYNNDYIESVWWAIKQIWNKNLIYKGHKVVPYCPRCGTSLSSHEVAQGYKEVKDRSAYVKFKLKDKQNEYFLAWTTTPWTLPSNVALVVNPQEYYSKVKVENKIYIIADSLVEKIFKETSYEIIEKIQGKKLEYIEYEPLFDFVKVEKNKAYIVVCDDYVTLTDGTGIVHCAPAFGEDDARIGKIYNLEFVQLVNEEGRLVEDVKPWANMFVKDADLLIIKALKEENKLFKSENYLHNYPFCWRCDTPLLYYARNTWFIKMTDLRDKLVTNNRTVNWIPENIKEGRFGNFLENVIDWSLSRERYWGTPLPIWQCECGYNHVIGSIKELKEMAVSDVDNNIELHKPYIDNIYLKCPKCDKKMKRVSEVIDCWFDSGSMPFAQFHYPFENKEIFEKNFPANFISEAIDQTRGWFYTLMAISTLIFDKAPYKNVIVLGHVQDKDGQKMSKHKGNVINPWDILSKQGADAIRWYFYSNSAPWLPSRFYNEAVNEYKRKFIGTLWNTYAFYVLYSNIDNFNPINYKLEKDKLNVIDRWILSKLNNLIKFIDNSLENYKITESARALENFIDNLSNWYVRRSRERFWESGMKQDKINAYMTLNTVLIKFIHLAAPFIPFITEEIYQNLVKDIYPNAYESIHLSNFPKLDESYIDTQLEKDMSEVLNIVYLGRAARNESKIKNRQALKTMYIKSETRLKNDYINIIKEELNIKELNFIEDVDSFTIYKFKPQLRKLGPKYGKLVPQIGQKLNELDGDKIAKELKKGYFDIKIEDNNIKLTKEDLIIEHTQKEGFVVCEDKKITIILDINLSESLIEEGFVREIVSKLQIMRKEAGYKVIDKIKFYFNGNKKISRIINKNLEEISKDILAEEILETKHDKCYTKIWDINGEMVEFSIKKV